MKNETRKETRFLRVTLTQDELLAAGKQQADTAIHLAQIEADQKRTADDFKAKKSSASAELAILASKISSGYEMKNVSCTVRFDDPETGRKTVTRDDTHEIVAIEPMTPAEMQRELV